MPNTFCDRRTLWRLASCLAAALVLHSPTAFGAWQEGFETAGTSWREVKADVAHRVLRHERIAGNQHGGEKAELLQIEAGDGTNVYFAHDIPAARVVAEFVPSVWIKADRPGIQLAARVVLPHTIDSRTGQPLTTLIHGTTREGSYSQTSRWQQLRISDAPLQLNRRVIVLRTEHGPQVDQREAYIDQIWLNVYGGSGVTSLVIDDLEVAGLVPRVATPKPAVDQANVPAGLNSVDTDNPLAATLRGDANVSQKITLMGGILHVDGRPFFPRIIQSQGEPLTWLKELGFNVVRVPSPPSPQMLDEARQLGMWIISPPPESEAEAAPTEQLQPGLLPNREGQSKMREIGAMYDRVLAWHLGTGLAARELPRVAEIAKQLRDADRRMHRPILCDAEEELFNYSAHVQLLSAHRFPLGSDLELIDYGSWLRERPRLARPGKPLWTVIQTEPSPSVVNQAKAIGGPAAAPTIDPDSLRLLVYQAFAAGVRGIEFASSSRLDAGDTGTRIRALALAMLNLELELIEPWGAAGSAPVPISSRDSSLRGVVTAADQAKLIVAMRCPKGSQYVPQPAPMQAAGASFVVPGIAESHDIYEVTLAGVRRLRHDRIAGGTSVAIEDFPLTALAIITADPIVVKAMSDRVKAATPRAAQLQRELAALMLNETSAIQQRLAEFSQLPPAMVALNAGHTALAKADQLRTAGDFGNAYFAARNATVTPARWRREVWNRTVAAHGSPVASPLASSISTLPEHLSFVASLAGLPPSGNMLVGGEFEDLQTMMQAGWRNFEHPQPQIKTFVELSPLAPFADHFCLRLQAVPEKPDVPPDLVESPPLWVTSAPVQLEAGDVVCIRGQARVAGKISGSVDGLMVIDSLGSDALAERIDASDNWREFVMYRAASQRGPLTVTFALTGIGEASIDQVSISLIRRGNGQPIEQARTYHSPQQSLPPRRF